MAEARTRRSMYRERLVHIERVSPWIGRTVVPLIDCFCHLATVKGFVAIVPFNYQLNYLSLVPHVSAFPPLFAAVHARVPLTNRGSLSRNFKTLLPMDRGSFYDVVDEILSLPLSLSLSLSLSFSPYTQGVWLEVRVIPQRAPAVFVSQRSFCFVHGPLKARRSKSVRSCNTAWAAEGNWSAAADGSITKWWSLSLLLSRVSDDSYTANTVYIRSSVWCRWYTQGVYGIRVTKASIMTTAILPSHTIP